MSDIQARRLKLLGQPATPTGPSESEMALSSLVSQAQGAAAEMLQAVAAERAEMRVVMDAMRGELASVRAECASMAERCNAAQIDAARAEERASAAARAADAAEAALAIERNRPMPAIPAPQQFDIDALAARFVALMPQPAQPTAPKALIYETRDSMGNPKVVRVTPEY